MKVIFKMPENRINKRKTACLSGFLNGGVGETRTLKIAVINRLNKGELKFRVQFRVKKLYIPHIYIIDSTV